MSLLRCLRLAGCGLWVAAVCTAQATPACCVLREHGYLIVPGGVRSWSPLSSRLDL